MRDYVDLGSTPVQEQCVCVTDKKPYLEEMKAECRRYKALLEKLYPELPPSCYFKIKTCYHDFGTYYEVGVSYDDDIPEAEEFAFKLQDNQPEYWDADVPDIKSIDDAIKWVKETYTSDSEVCELSCYIGNGKYRVYMQDGTIKELQIPIKSFRNWHRLHKEHCELEDKMMELEHQGKAETDEYLKVVDRINDITKQTEEILNEEYINKF